MPQVRDDQAYFHQRAEAELRMAQRATGSEATKAHYELAGHYLNIAFGGEPHSPPADASMQTLMEQ